MCSCVRDDLWGLEVQYPLSLEPGAREGGAPLVQAVCPCACGGAAAAASRDQGVVHAHRSWLAGGRAPEMVPASSVISKLEGDCKMVPISVFLPGESYCWSLPFWHLLWD